jgi:hypothetical protein
LFIAGLASEDFIPVVTPFSFFEVPEIWANCLKALARPGCRMVARAAKDKVSEWFLWLAGRGKENARQAKMARMMHVSAVPLSWKRLS